MATREQIRAVLDQLLPPERPSLASLVHAAVLERPDLTYPEIGKALGCSASYVKLVAKKYDCQRGIPWPKRNHHALDE